MNANTIATAIAALEHQRHGAFDRHQQSDDPYYLEMIAEINAAIADLEALQADSAAAPQPVSEWDEDRIWEYADRRTARYSGETKNIVRYETSECMRVMLTEIQRLSERMAELEQAAVRPPYLYETGLTGVAMPVDIDKTLRDALESKRMAITHMFSGTGISPREMLAPLDAALAWLDELQRRTGQDSITGDDK